MHFPQACLFDLDGVLLDTEGLHSEAWLKTATTFGSTLNDEQLTKLKGQRRIDCAQEIINWTKGEQSVEELLKIHQPISRKLMLNAKEMSGAKDLILWCISNTLPMALVTSSSASSVEFKSASNTWLKLIETRVYGDDERLKHGKPAPDPYLLAAEKLNTSPGSCWALEDSYSGVISANSAGCQVWILDPKNNIESQEFPVKRLTKPYRIKSLKEFLSQLKFLQNRN